MANYELLVSTEAVDQLIAPAAGRVLVFKHSLTCPISSAAFREFQRYLAGGAPDGTRVRLIEVQNARPASNRVAEVTGVRHESPQALLIEDGAVRWHRSHGQITAQALAAAVGQGEAAGQG